MARFEVFIPAATPDELNLTLRVTAGTWMAALKIGLRKIGHGSMPTDVLCDVKEDESIHVTDPRSGRVFRIAELPGMPEPEARPAMPPVGQESGFQLESPESDPPVASAPASAEQAPAESKSPRSLSPLEATPEEEALPVVAPLPLPRGPRPPQPKAVEPPPLGPPLLPVPPVRPVAPAPPPPLVATPVPVLAPAPVLPPVASAPPRAGRKQKPERVEVAEVPAPRLAQTRPIGRTSEEASVEDVLIELFEKTPAVFGKAREEALYFLLDLALEKIPAEAGSVYLADLNRRDLAFAAARGPKATELLALGVRVPMGRGFVGFCAQEGVTVAISDAASDPRFFKDISQRIGYPTRSVLTTPVLAGGRTLGAMQLINKRGETRFSHAELSILHYLAHQAALFLEAEG